jgi:hypothetical protein
MEGRTDQSASIPVRMEFLIGTGVTIAANASGGDTVFEVFPLAAMWTPSFSPDDRTVTFTAPAGASLTPGEQFFVNVSFTDYVGPNGVAFTGGL